MPYHLSGPAAQEANQFHENENETETEKMRNLSHIAIAAAGVFAHK